jgi:RepB DNA-primase from phage plasmid
MTISEPDNEKQLTPAEYIRANFLPSDRVAVLVRNRKRGETIQRISTVDKITAPSFQDWMQYKNAKDGSDVYVGMNALKPQTHTRTKEDILVIRHLYVDLDQDGSTSVAAIEKSNLVPPPSYVLNTSPDKYQVIWKVEDIEPGQAEALQHAMARRFDGDQAATDSARVLRIPGLMNKKYEPDFLVTIHSRTDRCYRLRDFKMRTDTVDSDYRQPRGFTRKAQNSEPRPLSQSERDWAYVKSSLASGADPEELIAQLARSRAADKSDPRYYARLTVTKALADLGMPSNQGGRTALADGDDARETRH